MERQEIFGIQYLTVVVWKLKLLVIRLGQEARYQAAWPGDRHSEGESDHTKRKREEMVASCKVAIIIRRVWASI